MTEIRPPQAQIEAAQGLDLLQNEMEYQRQINASGTAAPAIEWAINRIKDLAAAAEVGGASIGKTQPVSDAQAFAYAIDVTIERCAQVAEKGMYESESGIAAAFRIAAAIRALKDKP